MPQKAQNWPIFLLKIYRNLLSSICRKIGKMNLSTIIDKLSVIGNSRLDSIDLQNVHPCLGNKKSKNGKICFYIRT